MATKNTENAESYMIAWRIKKALKHRADKVREDDESFASFMHRAVLREAEHREQDFLRDNN